MSTPVELAELSVAAAKHHFGYLVTRGDQGHSHVVAVQPTVSESEVIVGDLGRRSLANVAAHPLVTVVWPPQEVGGYSLIVDGEAEAVSGSDSIQIRPSRAVLHRPAPAPGDLTSDACGSDCVELPVEAGSTR